MMGHRRSVVTAVLALLLVTSVDAFAPIRMEARRIQQQQSSKMQLKAHNPTDALAKTLAGIMTAGLLLFSSPLPSLAESRVIGELKGSGLVFKVRNTCSRFGW
jgi:hypothetical protein